jgi:hypothetical protein
MAQPKTAPSNSTTRVSSMFIVIIFVAVAAALILLTTSIYLFNQGEAEIENATYFLLFGAALLAVSTYILVQTRRRMLKLKIEVAPVMTTIECRKCGTKTTREFQKGDYIFKELEKCGKCDDNKMITAIYREVTEKEKEKPSPFLS